MPFDSMPLDKEKQKARDRGFQLAHALRNLPETHEWDFSFSGGKTKCGSIGCAIGLAYVIWPEFRETRGNSELEAKFFGLEERPYIDVVFGYGDWFQKNDSILDMSDVTPEMVADELERVLLKYDR